MREFRAHLPVGALFPDGVGPIRSGAAVVPAPGQLCNPVSSHQQQIECRQQNLQLTRTPAHHSGLVDQPKAQRFQPPHGPALQQNQPLHRRIEVERQNHDRPPGGVFAKIAREQLTAGLILLHDRVDFLAFTTTLAVPDDQLDAVDGSVGAGAPDLVALSAGRLAAVLLLLCLFVSGQRQLPAPKYAGRHETTGGPFLLCPA